ncbi:MAG TPA: bacteriohopanetetrol glucosamine biosynthesis glycosyltransferase HpnI [Candidatus Acidoferrales bacterium]|nr:bacteriohopanetetrol glucosamine biosynthesis glycosyltransferase HpnI [Candidatus Acidoferrales bacterium]
MSWAMIRDALLLVALAPFAYYACVIVAAARFFGTRSPALSDFAPPVSILKPIRGLDRESYENYASFCRQDYPEFEILFCVSDDSEPAISVIKQIMQDFPEHAIRLVFGSEPLGVSDKVNKLCRMAREARHGILVVSDSDVRVAPDFLRALVAPLGDSKVAGVTCLYRGLTDGSLAADLEALGNSTDFAAGVLTAWLLGDLRFMLGAVMATTKSHLAEIGGFEALVNHFSDDYELGNRMAACGYRIELDRFPVSIVYPRQNLADAFRHQLRWNLAIRCSRPWGHAGMIFAQGLPWALLAAAIAPAGSMVAAYLAGYAVLRVTVAWVVGVWGMQDDLAAKKMWMLPLRDAFAFLAWVSSFLPQRIHWRGQEFYVRNKQLVPVPSRHS